MKKNTEKNWVYVVTITKANNYAADTVTNIGAFTNRDKAVELLTTGGFITVDKGSNWIKSTNFDYTGAIYLLEVK